MSFLLSLGSSLYIAGHDTHVPLPFLLLAHVPLVQGLLSTRFALYTAMFGSALMAIGTDALRLRVAEIRVWPVLSLRKRKIIAVIVSLAVVVAVALPQLPLHAQTSSPSEVPAFFGSALAKREIPAGSTVLTYPYSDNPVFPGTALDFSYSPKYQGVNDALLDQAGSGFGFKLIGGYGWRPVGAANSISPSELAPAAVKDLFDYAFYGVTTRPGQAQALATNKLTAQIVTFLKKNDVESVFVLPVGHKPSTVANALSAAIGAPRRSGGVTAWFNVQHRLRTVMPRVLPSDEAATRHDTRQACHRVSPSWKPVPACRCIRRIRRERRRVRTIRDWFCANRYMPRVPLSVRLDLCMELHIGTEWDVHHAQCRHRFRRADRTEHRRQGARTRISHWRQQIRRRCAPFVVHLRLPDVPGLRASCHDRNPSARSKG